MVAEKVWCSSGVWWTLLQGHPEYVECHLHAAKAEAAKGNLEAAIEAAKRALEAKADHPEALAMLGSLHMAATRWGEAHKSFKALRDLPADPAQVCRSIHVPPH
jgi:Flp pilus assembly protein TadD